VQPLGRDILNWCADDQLFTASGAVAPGKSLPTQVRSRAAVPAAPVAPARPRRPSARRARRRVVRSHGRRLRAPRQQFRASRVTVHVVSPQGWPLADFPTAFAIAIAYLAFVVIGSIVMQVKDGRPRSKLRPMLAPLQPVRWLQHGDLGLSRLFCCAGTASCEQTCGAEADLHVPRPIAPLAAPASNMHRPP